MYRVGIDIGGTFTDLIALDEETGELHFGKTLTTPGDPSIGAVEGLKQVLAELRAEARQVREIIHGTTLAANALIERRGVPTGLITTSGFRDVLEIGREKRYDIYDVLLEMPKPLVPRFLRKEVTERVLADGEVLIPLDEDEAARVVRELVEEGVRAIAVAFLHAYRNPAHERRMAEIIRQVAPTVAVSLSSEVVPEIREYERTSTTVANAYTQPLMQRYLGKLQRDVEDLGYPGELYIMLSSGGLTARETAERYPIWVVESGPAAGALAASRYGSWLHLKNVMSFDMGGTTAKTCLIDEGKPLVTTDFEVAHVHRFRKGSGLPIKLPVIDMIEIGAGGGSIARVDEMELLKVGPRSSGAEPGPACYGRGGEEPTVTDADLVLGYLDPEYFLGGRMTLDVEAARRALERVARPFAVDVVQAAWGIHQVVNENMANAARVHTVQRGREPKAYSMVAFGGAGPVHAFGVAGKLGLRTIVVPFGAGVTSAAGFLMVPFAFNFVRSYVGRLRDLEPAHLNAIFEEMEAAGRDRLRTAGVPDEQITFTRSCDIRYVGQGFEVSVPLPNEPFDAGSLETVRAVFEREYQRQFARINPHTDIESLNWRVVASGPEPAFSLKKESADGRSLSAALKKHRPVFLGEDFVQCPVFDHYGLFPGARFDGPAIVEDIESTTVVGHGATVSVDEYLNLRIDRHE